MDENVRLELERLAAANGGLLLPEKVIQAASPEGSVLHPHFDWDDGSAAHLYRVGQANRLIRSYTVTFRPVSRTSHEIVIDRFSPHPLLPRGHVSTADLLAGPERGPLLRQESRRCRGHVTRLVAYLRAAGLDRPAGSLCRAMAEVEAAVAAIPEVEAGG